MCARCEYDLESDIAKWAEGVDRDLKSLELFDEYLARRCVRPDSRMPPETPKSGRGS